MLPIRPSEKVQNRLSQKKRVGDLDLINFGAMWGKFLPCRVVVNHAGGRTPAIRAVDRFASANPRRLRMNALQAGGYDCRTAFCQNCRCRLPPKGRIGNSVLSILGRFGRKTYPVTCRKSSGPRRWSVAGQNHWFQQLDVRKSLIRLKM